MSPLKSIHLPTSTFVVIGLGRSGLSTVRCLKRKGATVIAVDDQPDLINQAVKLGAKPLPSQIIWADIAAVVQSPGVPLSYPLTAEARRHDVPIIGDTDLLSLAHPNACFVGVTGTNGKSTTTALVGHILTSLGLNCQIGGNIGVPMLDLPPADIYVLELSSYQLDICQYLPLQVAAWTNLTSDHLDRHKTMEAYVAAKKRIFRPFHLDLRAIVAIDDVPSKELFESLSNQIPVLPVSVMQDLADGIYVKADYLRDGMNTILDLTAIPALKGTHNWQNIAVAYGICLSIPSSLLKVDLTKIAQAISTFPGLAHRQELVRTVNTISFVNDSKGTNAEATAKALASFDDIFWIAGGQAKEDGIDSLSSFFPKIVHTFLVGEAQDRFSVTLEGKVPYTKSGTIKKAIHAAYEMAKLKGSKAVVLLSPACASFDQFRDFEHRGNVFRAEVEAIEERARS